MITGALEQSPLIGESATMRDLRRQITRVARTSLSVLIEGPSGAGKELVAQGLHAESGRSGRFVAFNVCAVADGMFEDTLFGHVRGAFSGAISDNIGYCEEANGGSLLLDEIGSLGLAQQAKLLRVVETKTYRKVGARADHRSDFRLLTASNVSLEQLVSATMFRHDLLHRLAAIVIRVPRLDDHTEDIPLLVQHFAAQVAAPGPVAGFSARALEHLQSRAWPGNIRELKSVVERAIAFATTPRIGAEDVHAVLELAPRKMDPPVTDKHRRILETLLACDWDTVRAARALGINRSSLYRIVKRLRISRHSTSTNISASTADSETGGHGRDSLMRILPHSPSFAANEAESSRAC
jgi:DNA-binding NtrC family response regulator